jgi:tetratricopeptide (TPR) repeat protein
MEMTIVPSCCTSRRAAHDLPSASPMSRRNLVLVLWLAILSCTPVHGQSTVVELNEAGWKAITAGNSRRAATLFAEALALRPKDPVLLLGAGAAARMEGKPREAMTHLKQSVQLDPRLTAASVLLGQVAYEEGDADLAIKTYEAAMKHAPGERVLTSRLEEWRREATVHRTFEETRYDRFRVMFEGYADQSLALKATEVLSSAFWRIGQTLGAYPPETIVTVLYTEKQFRDLTQAPPWSGGQYDGRIRLPAAGAALKPAEFEELLTHELTHAVVDGIARKGVPAWLHEGLAQFFDGSDRQAALKRLRSAGRTIPLARLEQGFGRLGAMDARLAYDESLVAVGVMLDRPGFGWHQLLIALGDGHPFGRAIESFGFSYADLEAPFKR